MSFNKVVLMGNITKKPELKSTPGGSFVTSFSIGDNYSYFDKATNSRKEISQFHNIVAFGNNAKAISTYFDKGDPILLSGRIVNRSWEKDGEKKYRTEISLDSFTFVKSKGKREVEEGGAYVEPEIQYPEADTFDQGQNGVGDINPDDIPF